MLQRLIESASGNTNHQFYSSSSSRTTSSMDLRGQWQPGVDILLAGAAAAKPLWPAFCISADTALLYYQAIIEKTLDLMSHVPPISTFTFDGGSSHCCSTVCTTNIKMGIYFD